MAAVQKAELYPQMPGLFVVYAGVLPVGETTHVFCGHVPTVPLAAPRHCAPVLASVDEHDHAAALRGDALQPGDAWRTDFHLH